MNADPDWLLNCPTRLRPPLLRCAQGDWPPNLALMRIVIDAADRNAAEQAIRTADAAAMVLPPDQAGWLRGLVDLWRAWPAAWEAIRAVLREVDHTSAGTPREVIAGVAAGFDRAVRVSPEASVALYGLGSAEILSAATAELVGLLRRWDLLGSDRTVLDIGCGIGRLELMLGPEVGSMLGIDISAEMIAAARRRCAGLANIEFAVADGENLSVIGERRFDLILAVDSFPYIVHAGVAEAHIAGAAAALNDGGDLVVFNWSYRGDPEIDRHEVAALAEANGLAVIRCGDRDLRLWDGLGFNLRKLKRSEHPMPAVAI